MNDIVYLDVETILRIHDLQIIKYGGSQGIRDVVLLESALYRPQITFNGEDLYPALNLKAAVLMHSIILNHPFIDGNKRTGMFSGLVFLKLNNHNVIHTVEEVEKAALNIANKTWHLQAIAHWLEK